MPDFSSLLARGSLSRGASIVFTSRVSGAALGYLAQLLLVRWAGVEAYGLFSLAFAWASIFALASTLGVPQALVRLVPSYLATENRSRLRGLLQFSHRLVAGLSLGLAVLATASVFIWHTLLSSPNSPTGSSTSLFNLPLFNLPTTAWDLLIAAWIVAPGLALMSLYGQLCRSCNRMGAAYLFPQVGRPLLVIAVCGGIVALTPFGLSSTTLLLATAGCVLVVAVLQHRTARHALPPLRETPASTDRRSWMHLALPLLFVDGFASLMIQTDLLLVGAFIDADAVGHYRIALQTAIGVSFVISAAHGVSAPRFAASYADGDTAGLQRLVRRLIPWVSVLTCLAYGVLVIVAPYLLALFGPSFAQAYVPLVILATGHLFSGLTGPAGSLLQMTGHHVACAWVYGSVTAVKLVLGAIGFYFFGMIGGAVAATTAMIAWNVALHVLVRRRLGVTPSVLALLRPQGKEMGERDGERDGGRGEGMKG